MMYSHVIVCHYSLYKMQKCKDASQSIRDARLFKFDNPFKDLMTKQFLNLLKENMYTSSLTFFQGIKPSS